MRLITQIKHSQSYQEFASNTRLQWLLLLVCAILALSLFKSLSDSTSEKSQEVITQLNLLTRLEQTAKKEVDQGVVQELSTRYNQWISLLPPASSVSTAEAQALTLIDNKVQPYLKRARLNLVGSEPLSLGETQLWQVRINVNGQLEEKRLLELIQHFDRGQKRVRLVSLQYSPKAKGTFSFVVDLIYRREANDE